MMNTSPFTVILTSRQGAKIRFRCTDLDHAKSKFRQCAAEYGDMFGISIVAKGKRTAYDPKFNQVPTIFLEPR